MSYELTPSQKIAYDKFSKLKVGALFMKMGTGKTRVAIDLVNFNKVDFLLYLTPFSTIDNIKDELEKWGVNCEYKVVGYETIASSDSSYLELLSLLDNYNKKFIIADESIFIKNAFTKRHNRSIELRKKCQYALILNGTPVVKNMWDLFNQMEFLDERIIPYNSKQFMDLFFSEHRIKKMGEEIVFHKFYEPNGAVLSKLVEPYVFYSDLDFNKNIEENVIWIEPDWVYKEEYSLTKEKEIEKYCDYDSIITLFGQLNKCAAFYNKKNEEIANYIRNRRVIVFCNFLNEVEQISSMCDCYIITGNTTSKERNKIMTMFKEDNKPLLLTIGVGSYSLNLQFCNEIVYSSINFNFGVMEQSKYRIKRVGQENNIKYTYILTNFGINNFIMDNLNKKESLSDIVKSSINKNEEKELIAQVMK